MDLYSTLDDKHLISRRSDMDHSLTCKQHHACLQLVSVHQILPPQTEVAECGHLIAAYYSFIYHKRMKVRVSLVG